MNKLLGSLVLWLITSPTARAQTLTLDQLTYINGLEQLSQDAYLSERGWRFEHVTNQGDTLSYLNWRYYNTKNIAVGEVAVKQERGEQDAIFYIVSPRAPYEAIRNKVIDYHMELLGIDNSEGAVRTYYRGKRYDVRLSLSNDEGNPLYTVRVQPHGLVKGFTIGDDGKTTEQWVRLPTPTPEQKARWDALADSIELVNQKWEKQRRVPVKKSRK